MRSTRAPLPFRALGRPGPWLLVLLALAGALLAGCGGGGGGGNPTPAPVELGTKPLTVPSLTPVAFRNPFSAAATVTAGSASGPFVLDPSGLPTSAGAGEEILLPVRLDPTAPGPVAGSVGAVFDTGGSSQEVTVELTATVESVAWTRTPTTLAFGSVGVGQTKDLVLQLTNLAALSPVTLTSATLPGPAFSVVGSAFPVTVPPGQSVAFVVRYAPTLPGAVSGNAVFGPGNLGGGVSVPVTANGSVFSAEEITDYGFVSVDFQGRTGTLQVTVPADAIALSLEATASNDGTLIGLHELTGPDGTVYENASGTGAYVWGPAYAAWLTQVPNTDQAPVQLVAGGGTYSFRLRRLSGSSSSLHVRAIVERRAAGEAGLGTLDLNVWLAVGVPPTAATAATDIRLQAILARVDTILSQQGVRLGDVAYYDLTDPAYDSLSESEFGPMLSLTSGAAQERLNLFFLQTVLGGGVVGVSAAVGGPKVNGSINSGVASVYDSGFSTNLVGLIAAHEIGHYLGLYHTAESDGSHDFIDDTANCPSTGNDPSTPGCEQAGGGLLMHWQAVGGTTITDGQGAVLRGHPHVGAPLPGPGKPTAAVAAPSNALVLEALGLPDTWCGTCRAQAAADAARQAR